MGVRGQAAQIDSLVKQTLATAATLGIPLPSPIG